MKIGEPVAIPPVHGGKYHKGKYDEILHRAAALSNGDWLPVQMDSEDELVSVQVIAHGTRLYPRKTFQTMTDKKTLTLYIRKRPQSE